MQEKKITIRLTDEEFEILEEYCKDKMRNKSELLREFIRGLKVGSKGRDKYSL